MSVECIVYGLGVEINAPLLGLAGLPQPESIDVRIHLECFSGAHGPRTDLTPQEFYVSSDRDAKGIPEFTASRLQPDGHVRMAYSDGFVFDIDAQGLSVTGYMPPGHAVDEVSPCLLGPIMGVVLRLRGIPCLHASSVVIDDQAIGLVGASGAGKSTTAAAFARLGYPVLTDDVMALTSSTGHFLVQPAYPRVRLWPQSAAGLFGSADALPRMMPGWDKRFLSLLQPGYRFQREALPLTALYFLGPRTPGTSVSSIEAVNPAEALMTLVADSFATNFQDKARRAAEFELLSRLVTSIPLRRISAPDDLAHIDDLCQAIALDVRDRCASAETP